MPIALLALLGLGAVGVATVHKTRQVPAPARSGCAENRTPAWEGQGVPGEYESCPTAPTHSRHGHGHGHGHPMVMDGGLGVSVPRTTDLVPRTISAGKPVGTHGVPYTLMGYNMPGQELP